MSINRLRRGYSLLLLLFCLTTLSCRSSRNVRTYHAPPPPDIKPSVLQYVETDGFDELFETLLISQEPVIVIQTGLEQPEWGPRLNAWVAAWNRGGKIVDEPRRRVRLQAPLAPLAPAVVNGDGVRELRLLVADLMTRAENLAQRGSSWWSEERIQRRRIDLLQPYSLRFHRDEDGKILLIFFNGRYARYYREVMEAMAMPATEDAEGWARIVTCSHRKKNVPSITAQRTRTVAEEPAE